MLIFGSGKLVRFFTFTAFGVGLWAGLAYQRNRRTRDFSFEGRSVVITGGSRGLGLVLARQLVHRGASVALLARDIDELDRAVAQLAPALAPHAVVVPIRCDVTDREATDQAIAEAAARLGGIDVLIHDAGAIKVGPLEHMQPKDFEDAMRVHALGAVHATYAALPWLRRADRPRVVHVSSIGGLVPVPHLSAYCTGKFALTGFSEACRIELAREGIRVTTVCPSTMRTGSLSHVLFTGRHRQEYAWFAAASSLPILSLNADRTAYRILEACRGGRAIVTLSLRARLAALVHGLAPNLTVRVLALVNRLLPSPTTGSETRNGRQSRPPRMPDWVTAGSDQAAARNNEWDGTPGAAAPEGI